MPAKSLISWDAKTPVNLRMTENEPGSRAPETLPEMMAASTRRHPDRAAVKIKRDGKWKEWTYK